MPTTHRRLGFLSLSIPLVVALGSGCSPDCGSGFDSAKWKAARDGPILIESETDSERTRRELASKLVKCGTLENQTQRGVRELLGRPDRAGRDDNPEPHLYLTYDVGYRDGGYSGRKETLFITFRMNGEIVSAQAPDGDSRDRDSDDETFGKPYKPRSDLP